MKNLTFTLAMMCSVLYTHASFADPSEDKVVVFIHGSKSVNADDLLNLEKTILLKGYNLRAPDTLCDVVSGKGVEYFAPEYSSHATTIATLANSQISSLQVTTRVPLLPNFTIPGTTEVRSPGLPYIDLYLCN